MCVTTKNQFTALQQDREGKKVWNEEDGIRLENGNTTVRKPTNTRKTSSRKDSRPRYDSPQSTHDETQWSETSDDKKRTSWKDFNYIVDDGKNRGVSAVSQHESELLDMSMNSCEPDSVHDRHTVQQSVQTGISRAAETEFATL